MNINKALSVLAVWACLGGVATAQTQSNSIDAFNVTQQGDKVIVRITTKEPLNSVPPSFAIANPARIALDFPHTANALGRSSQELGEGDLRSMNVVQGADRTRIVLNLRRTLVHEATLDGRTLVVTLSPSVTTATPAGRQAVPFAAAKPEAAHAVRDVDFRRGSAGEGRVIVDLSDTTTGIDIRQQGQNIVVDFLKTSLPENLRRRLDVIDFATPVQTVSIFQQGENTRLIIEPHGKWEHNAYQSENQFVVEVKPIVEQRAAERPRYTGEKLSLNFQNVEVRAVLNVIADFTDLNIITSDTVTGNITLRLKDVPWDQALDIIMQTRGLDMRRSGNVIWIAPRDEIATREKLALESQQQITELEQTRTESFQINYQKAAEVKRLLSDPQQRLLSKRGSASVDERTNTLFVQDTPSRLEEVRKLLAKIDVPVRQVMIEARIVEASDSFAKNLGARLGYTENGATSPRTLGQTGGLQVGADLTSNATALVSGTTPPGTQQVNLPAAGLNGFNAGTVSFILFKQNFSRFITTEISAMEADGKGKIVSSPRVLTANQAEALIEQGQEFPFQAATSSGATSVSFRKAVLSLKVKPQITPDGNVVLTLEVNKDALGQLTAAGAAINTKHVKTEVLVENGGTVVIGGIFELSDRTDITKVPFFGDLPLIGFFFRNTTRSTSKTELLVFITPRIVAERVSTR
jgi:type IV pilus assembly protein PilQ